MMEWYQMDAYWWARAQSNTLTKEDRMEALRAKAAELQRRLLDRGMLDFKYTPDPQQEPDLEKRLRDTCHMLEQYLDGKTHPAPPLNDSVRNLNTDSEN